MNPKDSINKASNQGSHYPSPYVGSAQYKKDLEDYGAHLRNWPQNSTQMLRRVHSQADVKRFALIQAIINLREPEGRLTGAQDMLSAGLPSLLLDILSHRNSYVTDSDPHNRDAQYQYRVSLTEVTTSLMTTTSAYALWNGPFAQPIADIFDRLPTFWDFLWEDLIPSSILREPTQDMVDLRSSLIKLCVATQRVYYAVRQRSPDRMEKLLRILFHFWHEASDVDSRADCLCTMAFILKDPQEHDECGDSMMKNVVAFVQEAIFDTGLEKSTLLKVLDDLKNPYIGADGIELFMSLVTIIVSNEAIGRWLETQITPLRAAMRALTIRCQLSLCLENEELSDSVFFAASVTMFKLLSMAMTMDDQVARTMLNSQGTIQIIVFKLPSIVRQGDRDLAMGLMDVLQAYAALGRRYCIQSRTKLTLVHYVMIKEYRCVQELLVKIRTSLSREILSRWTSIGSQLAILPLLSSRERVLAKLDIPAWNGCHNSHCICNIVSPCHGLKVCRGCWKVKYCCIACQRKDWEEGRHRDVCSQ